MKGGTVDRSVCNKCHRIGYQYYCDYYNNIRCVDVNKCPGGLDDTNAGVSSDDYANQQLNERSAGE
jgi:hypothetical protein